MALILKEFKCKLSKDDNDNLIITACSVKGSQEDDSLKSYYEKVLSVDSDTLASLSTIFEALKSQLKSEDSLE